VFLPSYTETTEYLACKQAVQFELAGRLLMMMSLHICVNAVVVITTAGWRGYIQEKAFTKIVYQVIVILP